MLAEQPQRLPRAVRRVVGDDDVARDLAQEAVLRAGRSLDRLRGAPDEALVCAWLRTTAQRVALNHVRDRSRRPAVAPLDESCAIYTARGPAERAALAETAAQLQAALDALPGELREVVVQRLVLGRSTAQTSEALDISQALVKWRLHRARATLQGELSS